MLRNYTSLSYFLMKKGDRYVKRYAFLYIMRCFWGYRVRVGIRLHWKLNSCCRNYIDVRKEGDEL